MAGLFQVLKGTGEKGDARFKEAAALKGSDGKPLIIPFEDRANMIDAICTRPSAVDWDNDGDLDLVVGNFRGSLFLFEGDGKGKFTPEPTLIETAGEPLAIEGYHSDPFPIDWDGDGDLDLLSGSSKGGVQWSENTAGKGKTPELRAFKTLIAASKRLQYGELVNEKDLVGPASGTRVWADDINGDGKLDLLVGDDITLVAPADGIDTAEFKKRSEAWDKEHAAIMDKRNHGTKEEREATEKEYRALYEKREAFIQEDSTGFVWLYLQK